MRDHILIYLNGRRHEVRGGDVLLSLSDFVRRRLHLPGTKVVCAEGDCGACAVLVGRLEGGRLVYESIDSCIRFLYQLDCCHVITAEGLVAADGTLHPAQEAMVRCHGSQCGYCTPGFVTTLAGVFEQCTSRPDEGDLRGALAGNLCRCTGYVQIIEAGLSVVSAAVPPLAELYPEAGMVQEFAAHRALSIGIDAEGGRMVWVPATLAEALALRAEQPGARVVAGATDLGVMQNKGRFTPWQIIAIGGLAELRDCRVEQGVLTMGAGATWSAVERLAKDAAPQFHAILTRFGGPQIRNAGTVGGNIANASPIADSLPFLFVTEAVLVLASAGGERRVPINEFYQGYKKFDLAADELIVRVEVALPRQGEVLRLYKVSRRKDLDISTFTAAIMARIVDGRVEWARVAYGGVGPVVLRLPGTEAFLQGAALDEATFAEAGRIARGEITPISDVRGAAEYRLQLAENILRKFQHEVTDELLAHV